MENIKSVFESDDSNIIPIANHNSFEDVISVAKIHTEAIEHRSLCDLFMGYDKLRVITYSYSLNFIEHIIKYFKYVEIIIGADYIHEADDDFKKLEAYVLSLGKYYNDDVAKLIKKYPNVKAMLESGDLVIRISRMIIDHRKVYILDDSSNPSHTRVITGSANMSMKAWLGHQMETFEYDDGKFRYDIESSAFEMAMEMSSDITHETIAANIDDYVGSNPILQTAKNKKCCDLLFANINLKNDFNKKIEYVINIKNHSDIYNDFLKQSKAKSVNDKGLPIISASHFKSFEKQQHNYKKRKFEMIQTVTCDYPSLKIDLENRTALYDDKLWDLSSMDNEVRADIDELLGVFNNFDEFVGDIDDLKETHFKLLNIIFSSPFHAVMRNFAYVHDKPTESIPMFVTAASPTASCGKTFMIRVILRLMTGKDVRIYSGDKEAGIDNVKAYQQCVSGFPVFIDEIKAQTFGTLGTVIKHPEICERTNQTYMPMIILASNAVHAFDDTFRKRMVSLKFTARFPSDRDETRSRAIANDILSRLGTAFYRRYIVKMIELLNKECDKIISDVDIPVGYYPDILNLSSSAIISVLEDYNYDIPSYIQKLTWHGDYGVNSPKNYRKVIKEIEEYYRVNSSAFDFKKSDKVIINLEDNDKQAKAWVATLPSEINAQYITSGRSKLVVCDKTEFLKRININRSFLNRLFRKV